MMTFAFFLSLVTCLGSGYARYRILYETLCSRKKTVTLLVVGKVSLGNQVSFLRNEPS